MANGWTPERKKRQSLLIHRWNPSCHSTGPKTEGGKARSSLNALTHGGRSRSFKKSKDLFKLLFQMQEDLLNQNIIKLGPDQGTVIQKGFRMSSCE